MLKEFDKWNNKKKQLENRDIAFLFKESEVWWCSVGINIAAESCGKGVDFQRPVLIFKKLSKYTFIGIPISTQPKDGSWFCEINIHKEKRYALLYQIRMFSVNRFQHRIGTLDIKNFSKIRQKLETLLELSHSEQTN